MMRLHGSQLGNARAVLREGVFYRGDDAGEHEHMLMRDAHQKVNVDSGNAQIVFLDDDELRGVRCAAICTMRTLEDNANSPLFAAAANILIAGFDITAPA